MKRKPWSLVIIALLHVLAPLGNLFFNALRANRTISQQWYYWTEVIPTHLFFVYFFLPILAGVFIFICRRWSYWAYLLCLALVLISNVYSYMTSMNLNTLIALFVILAIDVLVVAYFVVPSVQKVYFDPRLRWWEAAPRYHFDKEGQVNGGNAFFKNLGQGGLFMTSGPELFEGDRSDIFWNSNGQDVRVSGVVVYKSPSRENQGYGIRFESVPNEMAKLIQAEIARLHAQGKIVAERLPGQEDSFGAWLKRLLTTGEGLFPKFRR